MKFLVEGKEVVAESGGGGAEAWQLIVSIAFMIATYHYAEKWYDCHGVANRVMELGAICLAAYVGWRLAVMIFIGIVLGITGTIAYYCLLCPLYSWINS